MKKKKANSKRKRAAGTPRGAALLQDTLHNFRCDMNGSMNVLKEELGIIARTLADRPADTRARADESRHVLIGTSVFPSRVAAVVRVVPGTRIQVRGGNVAGSISHTPVHSYFDVTRASLCFVIGDNVHLVDDQTLAQLADMARGAIVNTTRHVMRALFAAPRRRNRDDDESEDD